ncbi:MAG TPA: phosphatidate cytidylyltransferase [Terracidiphilus sp.]|jgi:phosphatidate cytidylyltransferase|nr:phosphatidate cytidylyltransferase [Terracidiphilus sp.]
MKRVLTAVVLIPVVLVLVFLPAHWQPLFVAVTALVAALAAWEYLGLARDLGANPPRIAVVVAILLLFAAWWQWQDPDKFFPAYGILCIALLLYCTFASPIQRVLPDATNSIFCLFYTGLTLIALPALREQSNGPSLLVFLLCVVWAGDTAAFYVGRAWGRHKLAPSISPKKTWEGSIASVAGSVLVAAGLLALSELLARWNSVALSYADETWQYWLVLAVILNVAAQVGDLAESALKRSAGVKDSGDLLPGHGGILDRIDALLLAAPALWYAQLIHHSF